MTVEFARHKLMLPSVRFAACGLLIALVAAPAWAENTPAPPDWQDGRSASVYMSKKQDTAGQQPATFSAPPISMPLSRNNDALAKPASHEETTPASPGSRQLAPPSSHTNFGATPNDHADAMPRHLADFGIPMKSAYTMITALAIVIGAFLLFTWAVRRANKSPSARRGMLPTDVVDVLGRVPLAARQFAQLLRVGNKLVLVALTPAGPTTLTEVTDQAEVDRLVGLCQQMDAKSTTKMFEQVFQQFSAEPADGGFLGSEKLPSTLSTAASAYRSQRGAARA